MKKLFRIRFLDSPSDNLKSKTCPELRRRIKNPKWSGLFAIALTFSFGGAVAQAQQAGKIPRIGFLLAPARSAVLESLDAFRQGLREIGYVEGQNIVIEY